MGRPVLAVIGIGLVVAAGCAGPADVPSTPSATASVGPASGGTSAASVSRSILVFTRTEGFHHDSIGPASTALDAALRAEGFAVTFTDDPAAITTPSLAGFGVVMFLSTSGDVLDGPNEAALEQWVDAGGGWVGVHSALDTEYDWPFYETLVGARFADHPAVQAATVRVEDPGHPAMRGIPAAWSRTDEWYNTRANPRSRVHVLATIDETSYEGGTMGGDHPLAWCHAVGRGQSFVTAMGHTDESWRDPAFVAHVVAGTVAVTQPGSCPTP